MGPSFRFYVAIINFFGCCVVNASFDVILYRGSVRSRHLKKGKESSNDFVSTGEKLYLSESGFVPPCDGHHYYYSFLFANGAIVAGHADDIWVETSVSYNDNDQVPISLHVSCSDEFPNGWGEKGGPTPGLHPQLKAHKIIRYKNDACQIKKVCGDMQMSVLAYGASDAFVEAQDGTVDVSSSDQSILLVLPTDGPTASPTSSPATSKTASPTAFRPQRPPSNPASPTSINAQEQISTISPTSRPVHEPTAAPTTACSNGSLENRGRLIMERLAVVSGSSILEDGTPQKRAADWMIFGDNVHACQPLLTQRYGLAVIFFGLSGDGWQRNARWLTVESECMWENVQCDQSSNTHVISLNLNENNLIGELPSEISQIKHLQFLNMFNNRISGGIPTAIRDLQSLELLDMENNSIRGQLVDEVFDIDSLVAILLSHNDLTGHISSKIDHLVNLEVLLLGNNSLGKSIPDEIGNLENLEFLLLFSNNLEGTIPESIGGINSLVQVDFRENALSGSIPDSFYSLQNLESLLLGSNKLNGQISRIGEITSLVDVCLNENYFSGPLPDFGSLVNIQVYEACCNGLTGSISPGVGSLQQLKLFDVSNNSLTGELPEDIYSLDKLELLYLSNNTFRGPISSSIKGLESIRDFWINGNSFQGQLPPIERGDLPNLQQLLIHQNLLSGTVPSSICALRKTDHLEDFWADCSTTEIYCDFPSCCTYCR